MKSLVRIIPIMAAALLLVSQPLLAAEGRMDQGAERGSGAQKDECLLVARNCATDSINARVERIEKEISKGSAVYSDEELKQLRQELQDASKIQKIYNNQFPPV
jgi:hypothetical protein